MDAPKAFISYSWSSEEHIDWVVQLAEALRSNGVDAILDKWDLREGHDPYAFMETMVTDGEVSKVIIVSDSTYVQKANEREGGVGAEAQIISPEVYRKADQNKFVVVVRENDAAGQATLPAFYGARIYVDMSDDDVFAENFEQLLRWIFDKPIYPKPVLGQRPSFIDDEGVSVGSWSKQAIAIKAIKSGKQNAPLLLTDYFDSVISGLESLKLPPAETTDDDIWNSISDFAPTRNQLAELTEVLCRSGLNEETLNVLKRFLEAFSSFQKMRDNVSRYRTGDWDNFRFLTTELFLILASRLIKWERFIELDWFLGNQYFVPGRQGDGGELRPFTFFNLGLDSFDSRNSRLKLNRFSLRADLLKERCETGNVNFEELIQADLVLYLRETADSWLAGISGTRPWRASTLIYTQYSGATEVFVRATSLRYFKRIKTMLGMKTVEDFHSVMEAIREKKVTTPPSNYSDSISVTKLSNAEKLGTSA